MNNGRMIYGYARVSTDAQDLTNQVAQLKANGCATNFREKISGATAGQPQLKKLMVKLDGDVVVIFTTGAMVAALFIVSACATVHQTYAPDGRKAYTLNCSGLARGINACLPQVNFALLPDMISLTVLARTPRLPAQAAMRPGVAPSRPRPTSDQC
jgi:hypothetical protein